MIARCIDFILEDESPVNLIKERKSMGGTYNKPDPKMISSLVGIMVKRSDQSKDVKNDVKVRFLVVVFELF